ncbi:MAG: hypothetical protein J6Z01_17480 [Bacteroidales bacterium]|nr:hypothetical protein [Bacteroidales bacterium]
MENTKTNCYNQMSELESNLIQYKNDYPISFNQIIYNNHRIIWMILLLFVVINIIPYIVYLTDNSGDIFMDYFVLCALIPIVKTTISLIKNREKSKEEQYLPTIQNIRQQLIEYEQYPDIKNYLKQFDETYKKVCEKKSKIKSKAYKLKQILIIIATTIVVGNALYFLLNFRDDQNPIAYLERNFPIDNKTTFITIKCLNDKANPIELLLSLDQKNNVTANFKTTKRYPENLRLTITDQNGNPVMEFPDVNWPANSQPEAAIINHDYYDKKIYYKPVYKLLTYLQTHQDSIFYTIEQIE